MSSQDTMNIAEAELQKAQDLERQAQETMQRAQAQADGFMQQAGVHRNQHTNLTSKAQDEQRQEEEQKAKEMAEQAREEQKRRDMLSAA